MNNKAKKLFKNLNHALSANFLVMGISILSNLIIPKFLGIKDYGYWQLYVFYFGFVGFFHLGWLDGIYLKEGGNEYEDLDRSSIGSQYWYHLFYEIILFVLLSVIVITSVHSDKKMVILLLTLVAMVVSNCRTFILLLFQATNRIREYAHLARDDKNIYFILSMVYLLSGGKSFIVLIVIDILSKLVMTIWGAFLIRDTIFKPILPLKDIAPQIKDNIKIGSNLMLSTVVSGLIIGIPRIFVEHQWDISTFAKLSFTLSISNMFMIFINSVGIVIFPLLRKINQSHLKKLYLNLRLPFVCLTFSILLAFIPIKHLLFTWLPEYKQSLIFMGILFPMIVYEGRMSLLISTYLKTLRFERLILLANLFGVVLSVVLSFISVFLTNNIYITVFSIMICIISRCVFAEVSLCKKMSIKINRKIFVEIILTLVFIISNFINSNLLGFTLYSLSFLIFISLNFKKLETSFNYLRNLAKDS